MSYYPRYKIVDGKKKCNTCGEIKPTDDYYLYKKGIRGSCKKCMNKKSKEYMKTVSKKTKSEWWHNSWENEEYRQRKYKSAQKRLTTIKEKSVEYLGGKCSKCGYDSCIEALEFHHLDPEIKEKRNNGRGIDRRKSFENQKSELDKCILLCANCHREEHYGQKIKNINSV